MPIGCEAAAPSVRSHDSTINPETLEKSSGWYDMNDGFSLLVRHGLFCITRMESDG